MVPTSARVPDLHFESVRVVELELPNTRLVEEAATQSPLAHLLLEMLQIEVAPVTEGKVQLEWVVVRAVAACLKRPF